MSFTDKPRAPRSPSRARPRLSLKMQAIGFLSRREHSRQELRAKLLEALRKRAREDAALAAAPGAEAARGRAEALPEAPTEAPFEPLRSNGIDDAFAPSLPNAAAADASSPDALELDDPESAVEQLLDWLAANNYLSDTRFVESRVNARSRKQGALRIKLELSRHGLKMEPEQATALRETEFARAQGLWQRRFGAVASEPKARAKQARFLAARGFAADVVRRVVGGDDDA